MTKDIINDKWIEPVLSIWASPKFIVECKRTMKDWADELGWEFDEDKEGSVDEFGRKGYLIKIIPKGNKISPEGLRKVKEKVYGFTERLFTENITQEDISKEGYLMILREIFLLGVEDAKKKEDIDILINYGGYLSLKYKLSDRVDLENRDLNLARFLFLTEAKEDLSKIDLKAGFFKQFFDKEEAEKRIKIKKKLKDFFDIDL